MIMSNVDPWNYNDTIGRQTQKALQAYYNTTIFFFTVPRVV